jgi:hypothetical protein
VFLPNIYTFDHNFVLILIATGAPLIPVQLPTRHEALYFTTNAYLITTDYLNGVTLFYTLHVSLPQKLCRDRPFATKLANFHPIQHDFRQIVQSTSGASETILMKPFSRNSLATGPKIRVPRGPRLSASRMTAAFSSNLIYEPSDRLISLAVRTTTARTIDPFLTAFNGAVGCRLLDSGHNDIPNTSVPSS